MSAASMVASPDGQIPANDSGPQSTAGKPALLFVDDEKEILSFYSKVFAAEYDVVTAENARAALDILSSDKKFAVITSDLNMPGLNGIDFLKEVTSLAPDAVRLMLTGYATKDAAIGAVNTGHVFQFLTKPISLAALKGAINDAVRLHERGRLERELLAETVKGSVSMLLEVLSMSNPTIFGQAAARGRLARHLCNALGISDSWAYEAAALLSNVGMLSLPQALIDRVAEGMALSNEELQLVQKQAVVGADLVRRVPRMEAVADAIALQYKNYDGSGYPQEQKLAGSAIPRGARILRLINAYQHLALRGSNHREIIETLRGDSRRFDAKMLSAIASVDDAEYQDQSVVTICVHSLHEGAVLAHDIRNNQNMLVVRAGQVVSEYLAERLRNFATEGLIADKVVIRNPGE